MSDPLRVAFVVEGPTDFIMLKEVVGRILEGKDFVPEILQPEMSEAFKVTVGLGGGWPGVCRWCLQATEQGGGRLRDNPLFVSHDVVIIQMDADVAENTYEQGHIRDPLPGQPTLPFKEDCPPPSATTNRKAILRGKPKRRRLVSGKTKKRDMYLKYAGEFADNWNTVKGVCTEAARFDQEFRAVLEPFLGS